MDIMKGPGIISILLLVIGPFVLAQNSTTKSAATTKASSPTLSTTKAPLTSSTMTTTRTVTITSTKSSPSSTRIISTSLTKTEKPSTVTTTIILTTLTTTKNQSTTTKSSTTAKSTTPLSTTITTVTSDKTSSTTKSATPTQISSVTTSGYAMFTNSTSSISGSSTVVTNSPPKTVLIAVVCTFVTLAVVIAVVILLFVYCRNRNLQEQRYPSLKTPVICSSKPCSIHDFLQHAADMKKDSGFRYAEEYGEELKQVGKYQSCDVADLKCNQGKNRYTNIKPYDISRVKLLLIDDTHDGSDYINASWMPGPYSRREYISTQGPLPSTRDDFWRMVWEYNCKGIVMLTDCVEKDKIKCDHYWPMDFNPVVYGDLEVKIIDEEVATDWTIRHMQMSMGQHVKYVKHLQYIAWCDMKVPDNPESVLEFVQVVRWQLATTCGGIRPTVVHCSAGVGRSGTFIALDTLLVELQEKASVDVYGVVYRLRMNRTSMVQTESQYMFLHTCLALVIQRMEDGEINLSIKEDESDDSRSMQTFRPNDSLTTLRTSDSHTTLRTSDSHMTLTTGDSHTTLMTGDSHTTLTTGDSHTTFMTGDSHTTLTTGDSRTTLTTGDSHTILVVADIN